MNKYTDELKRILKNSELIAISYNNEYVDSLHFLLSILDSDSNIKNILINNNIDKLIKIEKGNNKENIILYSLELLEAIESIIIDSNELLYDIDTNDILIKLLENKNSKCYKLLYQNNIDINNNIIKSIRKESINDKKMLIKDIAININEQVINNEIDKVYGRDKEINKLIEILARKNKNNPILIGEAGTGKTAVVEELARRIVNNDVPSFLKNKTILSLNLANVIAGTKYRGEFEEKLTKIVSELESNDNLILFIDEIHTIIGAGGAEGAIDASNIVKPSLARGKIKIIGATTNQEYNNTIVKDKALDRRFQKVLINEPSISETIDIIKSIKNEYEEFHNVIIDNKIIDKLVVLTNKYIKDKYNPDKSIDILDLICAKSSIKNNNNSKYKELDNLKELKKNYIINNEFKKASELIGKIEDLKGSIKTNKSKNIVTLDILKEALEDKCNTKIYELEKDDYLSNFNKQLKDEILFQDNIIDKLTNIIKDRFSSDVNKCLSINIIGKEGTGKSLISNKIVDILKINSVKIDGSEYTSNISINKIVGSPSGYVGYNEKNTVFETIKNYPLSIIIVDNIEFMHNEIKNTLNNIIKTNKLKLSNNETIDFSSTIFIFNKIYKEENLGFINNYKNDETNGDYDLILNEYSLNNIKKIIKHKYPNINITKELINSLDYKNYNLKKLTFICNEYAKKTLPI